MSAPSVTGSSGETRHGFPTTQWSAILATGSAVPADAREALAKLCARYWYPLYSFIRWQGNSHHSAEDLTQEFLARLLANNGIAKARPSRGRFRSFLLSALRNFLINEWSRSQAAKRGGGLPRAPEESGSTAERFAREAIDPGLSPEQAFERSWALCMIEHALAAVRAEYVANGRATLFDAIAPGIWGGGAPEPQARQAERLGLSLTAFKVTLHRMRRRLREHLECEIRATVETESEAVSELDYLFVVVGNRGTP